MLNTSAAAAELFQLNDLFSGLAGCSRVAVAVSGGSDSMGMLVLAADWAKAAHVELIALTVDHGLRLASADEARQVATWCAAMGVDHHVLQWRGEKPRTGIQAAARVARYDLMGEWCHAHGVDALLTAHTLDDQAETVVMRKLRTASAKSLAGIWPETQWKGLRVVRPVLDMRREELRNMLRVRRQAWIDDPSNDDEHFERVRVRKSLRAVDVISLNGVARDAQQVSRQQSGLVNAFYADAVRTDKFGCLTIARAEFCQLGDEVALEVLARAVFVAGAGVRPQRESVVGLLQWITGGGAGRRTLAGAVLAARSKQILVAREAGRVALEWVPATSEMLWDQRFEVSAPPGSLVGPMCLADGLEKQADIPIFVWNGLPVVKLSDGRVILSDHGEKFGVSAMFRERIWF